MRAVFDVNVLLRFTFGSTLVARLIERATDGEFDLLTHEVLAAELAETAAKPRLVRRVDETALADLTVFLRDVADSVEIKLPYPHCRDPDDQYLLAMARDGNAAVLVTSDRDLLCLSSIGTCEIATPEEFERRLAAIRA